LHYAKQKSILLKVLILLNVIYFTNSDNYIVDNRPKEDIVKIGDIEIPLTTMLEAIQDQYQNKIKI
jgi:hypothetical protein